MAKKSLMDKLQGTILKEEEFVAERNIGIDKFSEADKIFEQKKPEVKKKIPGIYKTYYFHSETVELIKLLSDKFFDMKIKANYSDVIAIALNKLSTLNNEDLTEVANEYLQNKVNYQSSGLYNWQTK